jgi:hypothetical protein
MHENFDGIMTTIINIGMALILHLRFCCRNGITFAFKILPHLPKNAYSFAVLVSQGILMKQDSVS